MSDVVHAVHAHGEINCTFVVSRPTREEAHDRAKELWEEAVAAFKESGRRDFHTTLTLS